MSEEGRFTLQLTQTQGYRTQIGFDWPQLADLGMDEPPPLGEGSGPNASRLLTAAAANCLSASLLYCLSKEDPPDHALRVEATCIMARNEKRRLRINRMEIDLVISQVLQDSPRLPRCLTLFEDFCVVSASIRAGIAMRVRVLDEAGNLLHESHD